MADLSIRFYSDVLKRDVSFLMVIPNDVRKDYPRDDLKRTDRPMKTLFLLHGYTGAAFNWVPGNLAEQYNFAIVIPNGENSFWIDGPATGRQFATFLGVELLEYVRSTFHLAMSREDTYILGFSMGGFGALHTAFAFPEKFGKTAALSSALIHNEVAKMKEGEANDVANYDYYKMCFGDPAKLPESDNNPEYLLKKQIAAGKKIPEIFMACGTEDFLLEPNRAFHKFLEEQGIKHTYLESKGIHDMKFWQEYAEKFIPLMF
ncbi:MAG: hypothetical protein J6V73_04125 [Spirochaetaceae bacterium]|nr:hypothetical protein [Spirochaetaceae bacterium]